MTNASNIFPRMHVSLYVSDLDKTIAFYNAFFGLDPVKVKTGYAKYVLEKPSLIISFVENASRVQSNFGHLGFQVETVEEMKERLVDAQTRQLVREVEFGVNCCFAKQDKFWVNDPDGTEWEVYYFHEDAEFNDPRYAEADSVCGCQTGAKWSKPANTLPETQPAVALPVAEKAMCC